MRVEDVLDKKKLELPYSVRGTIDMLNLASLVVTYVDSDHPQNYSIIMCTN